MFACADVLLQGDDNCYNYNNTDVLHPRTAVLLLTTIEAHPFLIK